MSNNIVGDAWIAIRPETSGFESALTTGLSGPLGKAEGMFSGVGGTIAKVGLGAAAAAAGIAGTSLKMAGDFQAATTQIVTGAGETAKNLDLIRQGILNMAGTVGQAPEALAAGLYNIESAGFHGAAGLTVLQTAAEGAKVGQADMATVADALTSALNAYHLPASDAVSVTNDLTATVASGKMHLDDLAGSLGKILPIASSLNIPLTQVSAAIATMTSQGTDASTATTGIRFLLANLAGPTKGAADELAALGVGTADIPGMLKATSDEIDKLGLHSSQVADVLSKQGLPAALKMVTDAIGKQFPIGSAAYEAALKNAVGGTRGLTAALELTGPNMATFQSNLTTITGAANDTSGSVKGWSLVQQDFNTKVDQAKGSFEALIITIGDHLLPAGTQVMGFLTDVISDLQGTHTATSDTDTAAQGFAGTLKDVGGFIANDVLPPLETMGGWMLDHKGVIEGIGAALATWWAVNKISGWVDSAVTAFGKVLGPAQQLWGFLMGSPSGGGGVSSVLNNATGMRVFVTNMPLGGFGGGGLTPAGGVAAEAGAAEAGAAEAGAGAAGSGLLGVGALPAAAAVLGTLSQSSDQGPYDRSKTDVGKAEALTAQLPQKTQKWLDGVTGASLGAAYANETMEQQNKELLALTQVVQSTGPLTRQQMQTFTLAWEQGTTDTDTLTRDIKHTTVDSGVLHGAVGGAAISATNLQGGLYNLLNPVAQIGGALSDLLSATEIAKLNVNRVANAIEQWSSPTGTGGVGHGALSGDTQQAPAPSMHASTHAPIHVTVNNPTSNVDVATALQNQQWLDRMNLRGIAPPPQFPGSGALS